MRRTGHILLLHHSEGERMRWLAQWFDLGLRGGDKVVYVDVSGWGPDTVAASLQRRGLDVGDAVKTGRFEFVSRESALGLGGADDVVRRALADGFPGVRLALRCGALAEVVGDDEAERVEQTISRLCHTLPVSVLCQYDGRLTRGAYLAHILDLHPDWVFEAELSVHRSGHVIQVEGRLDSLDEEVLSRSLARMSGQLDPALPLALDLRHVEALTTGSSRAVVDGTAAFRSHGGTVRIGAPSGTPGWLLKTLYDDRERGLEVLQDGAPGGPTGVVPPPSAPGRSGAPSW